MHEKYSVFKSIVFHMYMWNKFSAIIDVKRENFQIYNSVIEQWITSPKGSLALR